MKYINYFTTVILLVVMSSTMGYSQELSKDEYYYYKGQKLKLSKNKSAMAFSIESATDLANFRSSFRSFSSFQLTEILTDQTKKGIIALHSKKKSNETDLSYYVEAKSSITLSEKEYDRLVKRYNETSNVLVASPIYITENGTEIGLTNYLYVQLKDKSDLQILYKQAADLNLDIIGYNQYMPDWITLSVTEESEYTALEYANLLFETGNFEASEPAFMLKNLLQSNDTYFDDQWMLDNTGQNGGVATIDADAEQAWLTTTGDSVNVAVLDQGFEMDHPDLQPNVIGTGFDAQSNSTPSVVRGNHGTPCAGIIGAVKDNNAGIAGIAPDANLISISIAFDAGTTYQMLANGINWGWQNGADVISNSWGGGNPSSIFDNSINNALNNGRGGLGTIIVFSSGNDNIDGAQYPSNSNPRILCVGAIDRCGIRSGRIDIIPESCDPWVPESRPGSSFGLPLDVVAGGSSISSTDRQGSSGYNVSGFEDYSNIDYTDGFGGTSAACPYVAGIAALILDTNPDLTVDEVNTIIEQSAQKIRTDNYTYTNSSNRPNGIWNNELGYGLVNANQAVTLAGNFGCPQDLTITQNVNSGQTDLQEAENSIRAINIISNNSTAAYDAGDVVIMRPGFHAREGSDFRAFIEGCSTRNSKSFVRQEFSGYDQILTENNTDVIEKTIRLAPNPTSDKIQLRTEYPIISWEINNQYGFSQMKESVNSNNITEASLNLSDYPTGIYFLKVFFSDGDIVTKTIIKV